MCCHFDSVSVAGDLTMALVQPMMDMLGWRPHGNVSGRWFLDFPEKRYIQADLFVPHKITFAIMPHIGDHTVEEHSRSALLASTLLMMLGVMGEQCSDLEIRQNALLGACKNGNEASSLLVIASYPARPLAHSGLCYGFQTVLEKGVGDASHGSF